jgi:hypothetical protein
MFIIINEEDEDEDGQATSTAKKRKVTVKPIYIVHETLENAILAIEFIQNEGIWNNYCISNKTKDGTKSYYGCKNNKQGQPSSNNGLESNNRFVKEKFTLRERMAISRYLENSFDMVRNWSKDRDGEKSFKFGVKV